MILFSFLVYRQEVFAEDENEVGSESDDEIEKDRKISFEDQHNGKMLAGPKITSVIDSKLPSRKVSAMNSASNSAGPSRRWSRHSSPRRGELLKMDDEVLVSFINLCAHFCNFVDAHN